MLYTTSPLHGLLNHVETSYVIHVYGCIIFLIESRAPPGRKPIANTLNTLIQSVWSHLQLCSQNQKKFHLHFRHTVRVLCSLPIVPQEGILKISSVTNIPKHTLSKTVYFQLYLKMFGQHMLHGCKAVHCKRAKSKIQVLLLIYRR